MIKAYTILETVITLVLIGIIVSVVYVTYGFISQNMQNYVAMETENFKLNNFKTILEEDFFKSEKVTAFNDNKIRVQFYNETNVEYQYDGRYLIRASILSKDTIMAKEVQLGYVENQKADIERVESLVSSMHVSVQLYGKSVPLYVYKNYYSNLLSN